MTQAHSASQMPQTQPGQEQSRQPGIEAAMDPAPVIIRDGYGEQQRLRGRVALITGGDSGIGRAVAVHYAREGANVAIAFLDEDEDAQDCKRMVEAEGGECLLLPGDLADPAHCRDVVAKTLERFGRLDILVNNAAEQHEVDRPEELSAEQIERTFRTNIFAYMHLATAALEHMGEGASIINTSSVTGARGHKTLIDYASTKGAIQAFTFSLAQAVADRGIRVNSVAPGPIWTPLIPASFDADKVEEFGSDTLMKRAGQPAEVAPAYVFLATQEASYITGQTIHINGGGFISA